MEGNEAKKKSPPTKNYILAPTNCGKGIAKGKRPSVEGTENRTIRYENCHFLVLETLGEALYHSK